MSNTDKVRPGVDANIVEANTVRGHDAVLTGNAPEDLTITPGRNETDNATALVTVWNRTDDIQEQVFDMRAGADIGTDFHAQMFVGRVDPTGVVNAVVGSLYITTSPAKLYQNTDGALAWDVISDDLGGENLEETLAIGNFTGNNPIVISDQALAVIQGEDSIDATGGGSVGVRGGNETGAVGDGGSVTLDTGASAGGNTGSVVVSTAAQAAGGATGQVALSTGIASGGGDGGFIVLNAGAGAQGGEINATAGDGFAAGNRGGRVQLFAGNSLATGDGGSVNIVAGSATTPPAISNTFTAGEGGNINLFGGNSAGAINGGTIGLIAGDGGSGGADGGDIFLVAGAGGGGGAEGEVVATAVFRSDNIKRGNGDPNVLGTTGDEGAIYQRTTGGLGQLWVNTNGTSTGWVQLAASGAFAESFVRSQYGTVAAVSQITAGIADWDLVSSFGMFSGSKLASAGGPSITRSQDEGGIKATMTVSAAAMHIGYDIDLGFGRGNLQRQQKFVYASKFKMSSLNADHRGFIGVSTHELPVMVGSNNPAASFIGMQKLDGLTEWRFVTRGTGVNVPGGQFTFATDEVHWLILDCSVPDTIVFLLIDSTNTIVQQATLDTTVSPTTSPTDTDLMRPVFGIEGTAATFTTAGFYHTSAITMADVVGGGGSGGTNPNLETVLATGNYTGANSIILTDADPFFGGLIAGELNPPLNTPDGGRITIAGGSTTDLTGTGGSVSLFSGFPAIGSAFTSGLVILASGNVIDPANTGGTGDVLLTSGLTTGSGDSGFLAMETGDVVGGDSGDVDLTTGVSVGGDSGDVTISTGTGVTAGSVSLEAGDSSAGFGGDILAVAGDGGGAGTGAAGSIGLLAGSPDPASAFAGGGVAMFGTGGATTGDGGPIFIVAGPGGPGGAAAGGPVNLTAGDGGAAGGTGGTVTIDAGDGVGGVSAGGDISLNPGAGFGGASAGAVIVNGKLTVTGLIDPTGLLFTGQAALPATPGIGDGIIWVDNTGLASVLKYTDDLGTTITVGSGGGGDLATVLAGGNETNSIAIKGSDDATGNGLALELNGGNSTGAGGSGGEVRLTGGFPDPGGSGIGGAVILTAPPGVDTGEGGDVTINTGAGDAGAAVGGTGGDLDVVLGAGGADANGGRFTLVSGLGTGTGSGGDFQAILNNSGTGGGTGGAYSLVSGSGGLGSGGAGGDFVATLGSGDTAGNGGSFLFTVGTGGGPGVDGTFQVTGDATFSNDVTVNGKLTVLGLIDPTGLLLTSQGGAPFVPAGSDGGIWVNGAGDLIFTNGGGDTNISTGGGGSSGNFLDSLLESAYGMVGPGTTPTGIFTVSTQNFLFATSAILSNTEGLVNTFTTIAANLDAEAYKASDVLISRTQRFKSVFKFALAGADANQRFFAGLSDTVATQLGSDDPVNEYVGIQTTLAGTSLQFVARGSISAMTPQAAIAADTTAHFLVIDASSTAQIEFTLLAADGVTVEATHTQATGTNIPALTTPMGLMQGAHSGNGGAPVSTATNMDFHYSAVVCRADILPNIFSGSQNLATVLTNGNASGGNDIVLTAGDSILGLSQAGPGGDLLLTSGSSTGGGGASGAVTIISGANDPGGNTGSVSLASANAIGTVGDSGGSAALVGGNAASNTAGAGGFGGASFVAAGTGGDSTGGNGGNGGFVTSLAGAGGDASGAGLDGGTGGAATLRSGAGGDTSVAGQTGGAAGSTLVRGDDGGANTASGDGGLGGPVDIIAGVGGAGAGAAGAGGDAGDLNLTSSKGGAGTGTGDPGRGGDVTVTAGDSGAGGTDDERGGRVTIASGTPATSVTTSDPGGVFIQTEGPIPASFGGLNTRIKLATTINGANSGAQVVLTSATVGAGGGISLIPGAAPPGAEGTVVIGKMFPAAPGIQFSNPGSVGAYPGTGVIDLGGFPIAPGDTYVISFNAPFAVAPSCVQITLAQDPGGPPVAAVPGWTYNVHSITTTTFAITIPPGFPTGLGGFGIMWTAFL